MNVQNHHIQQIYSTEMAASILSKISWLLCTLHTHYPLGKMTSNVLLREKLRTGRLLPLKSIEMSWTFCRSSTPWCHWLCALIWKCSAGSHETVKQSLVTRDYYIMLSETGKSMKSPADSLTKTSHIQYTEAILALGAAGEELSSLTSWWWDIKTWVILKELTGIHYKKDTQMISASKLYPSRVKPRGFWQDEGTAFHSQGDNQHEKVWASDLRGKFHLTRLISSWLSPNEVIPISLPLSHAGLVLLQPQCEEAERPPSLCKGSSWHVQSGMRREGGNGIPSQGSWLLYSLKYFCTEDCQVGCCCSRNWLSNKHTKLTQTFGLRSGMPRSDRFYNI